MGFIILSLITLCIGIYLFVRNKKLIAKKYMKLRELKKGSKFPTLLQYMFPYVSCWAHDRDHIIFSFDKNNSGLFVEVDKKKNGTMIISYIRED